MCVSRVTISSRHPAGSRSPGVAVHARCLNHRTPPLSSIPRPMSIALSPLLWRCPPACSVVAALQLPAEYVQSICASLEKSLSAQVLLY